MKRAPSSARCTAASISCLMSAYWALRSSSGTVMAAFTVSAATVSSSRCRIPISCVAPTLVLEPLLDRHLAPRLRRRAHHDGAGRYVAGHHRPGGDQAVLADHDSGQDDRAGADASALLHGDALEVLEALGGSAHVVVVRGHHPGRHEHAVLERRVRGDVALALELAVAADGAEVLDRDATADDRAAADRHVLAHGAQVGHQHLAVDRRAPVEHHAGADDAQVADREGRQLLLL